MSEAAETELPRAVIKRLVKTHLDKLALASADKKNYQLNADALMAFCESAKYFISYLTAAANDICKEKKRQTISADDILSALDELEMMQFVEPLKEALQGYKVEQKDKSSKKAEQTKKRRSEHAGDDAGEASGPSPKQAKGDEEGAADEAGEGQEDAAAEEGEDEDNAEGAEEDAAAEEEEDAAASEDAGDSDHAEDGTDDHDDHSEQE